MDSLKQLMNNIRSSQSISVSTGHGQQVVPIYSRHQIIVTFELSAIIITTKVFGFTPTPDVDTVNWHETPSHSFADHSCVKSLNELLIVPVHFSLISFLRPRRELGCRQILRMSKKLAHKQAIILIDRFVLLENESLCSISDKFSGEFRRTPSVKI